MAGHLTAVSAMADASTPGSVIIAELVDVLDRRLPHVHPDDPAAEHLRELRRALAPMPRLLRGS